MGAGKSTIGRQLAELMHRPFFDTDKAIEERTGAAISWIFELEGEPGFRLREQRIVDELTALEGVVLATGGGAILDPANRRCLAGRGFVVYLKVSIEQQLERTRRDRTRPLLQTPDPEARLLELIRQREPLYREVADLTVNTNGRSVKAVALDILRHLDTESLSRHD
ncbi:MAG: shikimate kinase AroK [Gammaproteobacteria bacterium]|nr:shikimate kinase AroK [Gammaproteobacteria bacterium]